MGYNQLYLYTEDTYEIKDEPYFGYMRGRYTENELKEIDDFAFSFGVEVIPCIQTLAHLNGIFRWKEFKKINDINDILLVDDKEWFCENKPFGFEVQDLRIGGLKARVETCKNRLN